MQVGQKLGGCLHLLFVLKPQALSVKEQGYICHVNRELTCYFGDTEPRPVKGIYVDHDQYIMINIDITKRYRYTYS